MRLMMKRLLVALTAFAALHAPAGMAANNNGVGFCGGTVTPGEPTDMENQLGEMTLQAAVDQPASMTTCGKGYLLAKCGDHENANRIFDKCIAAGYVGAMIWKALQFENGNGTAEDLKAAAELLERAANSGDPAYGPIGRLHYATVLFEGRGVPRNPEQAMKLFQQAAAEGNEEALEFLRTGYHTGSRNGQGMGAGKPTAAALAPQVSPSSATAPVNGLHLKAAHSVPSLPTPGLGGLLLLLLAAFLLGFLFQRPATAIRIRPQMPGCSGT